MRTSSMYTPYVGVKHKRSFGFLFTFGTSKILSASMYTPHLVVNNLLGLNLLSHLKHLKFRVPLCIDLMWSSKTPEFFISLPHFLQTNHYYFKTRVSISIWHTLKELRHVYIACGCQTQQKFLILFHIWNIQSSECLHVYTSCLSITCWVWIHYCI